MVRSISIFQEGKIMLKALPTQLKRFWVLLPCRIIMGLIVFLCMDVSGAVVEDMQSILTANKTVTEAQADQAATLLDDDDPFVRGMAEWIIARKVEAENGGQEVLWPRENPPDWFKKWNGLSFDFLLECDYARQAISLGIDGDAQKLLKSAELFVASTEKAVNRQLDPLRTMLDHFAEQVKTNPQAMADHHRTWLAIRKAARPLVLTNPDLDFTDIVFIKRHAAHSHRNITGSQYPWVHKPGGDIMRMSGLNNGALSSVIAGKLGPGHVHGMDLWWDADRLVFAFARQKEWPPPFDTVKGNDVFKLRRCQEPTHLFEIRLDGEGLRQLTDHDTWNDLEPTYCANGDVAFASDRSGRSSECGFFTADHTGINIYKVTADEGRISLLTDNKDIDRYPHSLDNGLIAYTRWDYQERHFFEVHSIWTMRPDGTMADAVFNQHMRAPYGVRDVRSVPGSARLVAIATGHHTFAYGPVIVVNPGQGVNSEDAVEVITPGVVPQEGPPAGKPVAAGGVRDGGGVYQTPWALSDDTFLVSYSYKHKSTSGGGDNATGFAVYYIDAYGNKELLHRDPILSCAFPMPVKKRVRPPVLPDSTDLSKPYATCYVPDVYEGMTDVGRGDVKYIRISQRVPWPLDRETGAKRWISGNAFSSQLGFWSWAPPRVIGTVAVEADGSACFVVPPDTALYFQALDENKMELRRMRTHVSMKSGESRGCTGCHETRTKTPTGDYPKKPLALNRSPSVPVPPPWGNQKLLGYEWLIQPILDKHCVRCHGVEKTDGGLDFTATRDKDGFMQSFRTLFGYKPGQTEKPGKILVSCSNRFSDHHVSKIKEFGSHRSPFITVLRDDKLHVKEVKLNSEEWETLVTWVDSNAPYYDTFFNKRPEGGGAPIRNYILPPFPPFPPVEGLSLNTVPVNR